VSRFGREARALSQLSHPNTVRVFDYGELEDGPLYIIMEFLEGRNLNQTVRVEGAFVVERALPILIQSCGALDEAHKAGIIHRDLKPENIFLVQSASHRDFPKLLDFGLAKVGEQQMRPGSVVLTQEGMVFGTPEFMSPEQAQGKALTPASDTYSLAVILYEVLTGKLPFDAKSAMDFIQLHVTGKPIPLSQRVPGRTFPPLLDQIMDRALGKKAEERYASAADFAAAMQFVLQGATQLPPHLAGSRANEIPTAKAVPVPAQVAAAGQRQQAQAQAQRALAQQPYAQGQQPYAQAQQPYAQNPQQRPMMQNGPAAAMQMGHPQQPMSPRSMPGPAPRANVGVLIGVAVAFLLIGVGIAVALMKFVMR
jgi:serine/threonine-protein kinase